MTKQNNHNQTKGLGEAWGEILKHLDFFLVKAGNWVHTRVVTESSSGGRKNHYISTKEGTGEGGSGRGKTQNKTKKAKGVREKKTYKRSKDIGVRKYPWVAVYHRPVYNEKRGRGV